MATLIPRLNRLDPQAPASVGRLEITSPNLLQATAPLREGVAAGVEQAVDAYQSYNREIRKQELAAKDLKATEIVNGVEVLGRTSLAQIGQKKGDTTPDYQTFDQNLQTWRDEALKKTEDPEIQQLIDKKLSGTYGRLNETRGIQQAKQFYGYQQDIINSSVKLTQDDAMSMAQILDSRDPNTFVPFKSRIDRIVEFREAEAFQNGMISGYDEKGNPVWSPVVEEKIRKDVGDTLVPTVKSLNAAGKASEARQLIEEYEPWLNATDRAKLIQENDEASVKNKALAELAKFQGNPTIAEINAMNVPEDVKLKMREINHTNTLHQERENKAKADATFLKMMDEIDTLAKSKRPYVDASDFKDRSALYKNNKEMLSANQRKALESYFDSNRKTDPDLMAQIWDDFTNNSLGTYSGAMIVEMRNKLSRRDVGVFEQLLKTQTSPTSEASKNTLSNSSVKRVERSVADMVYDDGTPIFKKKSNGKFRKEDNEIINELNRDVLEYVSDTKRWTLDGEQEFITQRLQEIKARKQQERETSFGQSVRNFFGNFLSGEQKKKTPNTFNGGASITEPIPLPAKKPSKAQPGQSNNTSGMSNWTTEQWVDDYAARHNGDIPDNIGTLIKSWKQKRLSGEVK